MEAVRIGESPPAPLLTVIVGPSEDNSVRNQKKELAERYDIRRNWWTQVVAHPKAKLHAHITPGAYSWIGTSVGVRGLNLNYVVTQDACGAELYIDRGKEADEENKAIYDQLFAAREEIEAAVSLPIFYQRLDERRACRIKIELEGGYRSPEEDWPEIQSRMIASMTELNSGLQPHIKKLNLGN